MSVTKNQMKKAFVVSFDQLPACMLGCYGHQWIETPNFDRLASLSVVFDQHYANDVSSSNSHPWWTGNPLPQACAVTDSEEKTSLIGHLKQLGIQTTILLETEEQNESNSISGIQKTLLEEFDRSERISGENDFKVSEDKTPVAQLMQAAIQRLPDWMSSSEDQLIWIHSAGVPGLPLAPEFFSTLYLDEVLDQGDDEEAFSDAAETSDLPDESEIETLEADETSEDDLDEEDWQELVTVVAELFTHPEEWSELDSHERRMARAVYAGYVTLLDQWLGRFLDQLLEYAETEPIFLIVTSAQGGNELLGPAREVENWGLLEETTHVPLFIFDSANQQAGTRRQVLSQPADLPATLLSWAGVSRDQTRGTGVNLHELIHDPSLATHTVLYVASDRAFALRTAEFYYLEQLELPGQPDSADPDILRESEQRQLYQKPSDRWDVYEIHAQHPETVAELSALLNQKMRSEPR